MLRERGIVCFMWSLQARSCVLCFVSTSVELCVLCGIRKRGIVCFVLSPRVWNCNVLRKRGIVCFVLSPRVWNCVLYVASASAELCALYCLHERGIVMCSASTELCALYCLHERGIVCFMWHPQAQNCVLCIVSTSMEL